MVRKRVDKKDFPFTEVVETFKALVDAGVRPEEFKIIRSDPVCALRIATAIALATENEISWPFLQWEDDWTAVVSSVTAVAFDVMERRDECYVYVNWSKDEGNRAELLLEKPTFKDGRKSDDQIPVWAFLQYGYQVKMSVEFQRELNRSLECGSLKSIRELDLPGQPTTVDVFRIVAGEQ